MLSTSRDLSVQTALSLVSASGRLCRTVDVDEWAAHTAVLTRRVCNVTQPQASSVTRLTASTHSKSSQQALQWYMATATDVILSALAVTLLWKISALLPSSLDLRAVYAASVATWHGTGPELHPNVTRCRRLPRLRSQKGISISVEALTCPTIPDSCSAPVSTSSVTYDSSL